jgi:hypothetical protein
MATPTQRIVIALVLLCALPEARVAGKPIRGAGAQSCGAWTQERKTGSVNMELSWIQGFISAYTHYNQTDIFEGTDIPAITAWMDTYCAANPLETIYNGAVQLVETLRKRSRTR